MMKFFKRKKGINVNILLVSMVSNEYLFDQWCIMDMLCSGDDCTEDNLLELTAIERELVRRGIGNCDGKIVPREIKGFYVRKRGNSTWE